MKIRNGFVSNSSSSSFIVINNSGDLMIPDKDFFLNENDYYSIGTHLGGCCTFG